MVASANHGKSANGAKSSRPSSRSQKPWRETFVTSGAKVCLPGAADLIGVLPGQSERGGQPLRRQPIVLCQLHRWGEPELRFARSVLNVYVGALFLSREEVEPVPSHPQDRRAHATKIACTKWLYEASRKEDWAASWTIWCLVGCGLTSRVKQRRGHRLLKRSTDGRPRRLLQRVVRWH